MAYVFCGSVEIIIISFVDDIIFFSISGPRSELLSQWLSASNWKRRQFLSDMGFEKKRDAIFYTSS
jgi:hypothetical protein